MYSLILFFAIAEINLYAAMVVSVHACDSFSRDSGRALQQRQHSKAPILDHI